MKNKLRNTDLEPGKVIFKRENWYELRDLE